MEHYVGLDVSLKLTAICIVDRTGKIEREGVVASDPESIVAFVKSHAPHVARIGLETGATSTWLWTELNKMGLPVICIDARHAIGAAGTGLFFDAQWPHLYWNQRPATLVEITASCEQWRFR